MAVRCLAWSVELEGLAHQSSKMGYRKWRTSPREGEGECWGCDTCRKYRWRFEVDVRNVGLKLEETKSVQRLKLWGSLLSYMNFSSSHGHGKACPGREYWIYWMKTRREWMMKSGEIQCERSRWRKRWFTHLPPDALFCIHRKYWRQHQFWEIALDISLFISIWFCFRSCSLWIIGSVLQL